MNKYRTEAFNSRSRKSVPHKECTTCGSTTCTIDTTDHYHWTLNGSHGKSY